MASMTGASQGRGQVPVRWGPLTDGELGRVPSEDMPPQMHRVAGCLLGLCAVRHVWPWALPCTSREDLGRAAAARARTTPRLPWTHSRASEEARTCHDVC